jgi:hypothetical protein
MGLRTVSLMAAGAGCVLAVVTSGPAWSQGPRNLGEVLRGSPGLTAAPSVARYVSDRGPGFVLDRSSATPLLKYDNSNEVWVLQARPAGRGDTIYVNDAGEVVLRATRLGGLTMFTDERPQGVPVALRGGATPIPTEITMSMPTFVRRLRDSGERISDLVPNFKKISFSSDDTAAPLLAEAATIAADAIQTAVRQKKNSAVMGIERLVLRDGPKPSVMLDHGILTVTVTPGMGIAGRPSSEKISRAIRGGGLHVAGH